MNPFVAPKDYSEMLNKIAVFTFATAVGLTALVAASSLQAGTFLAYFNIPLKVGVLGVDGILTGYLIPALIIALVSRVLRMHDRLSDLFQIRKRFDVYEILIPLAGGAGQPVTVARLKRFKEKRNELMSAVFYEYASSTEPKISKHNITMALDTWSWFWILAESLAVGCVALIVLLALQSFTAAAWVATCLFVLTLVLTVAYRACAPKAHIQVNDILGNSKRVLDIQLAFIKLAPF